MPPARPLVCSWSGGKDSALALYRGVRAGGRPAALLTMLTEEGRRSRSHGLPLAVLEAQANAIGVPLVTRSTSWSSYEATFIDALGTIAAGGVKVGVFGDIDVDSHRAWVERVCAAAGLEAWLPLWERARGELLEELLEEGFRAAIVAIRDGVLRRALLGRAVDAELVAELERARIDLSGELGEYHTVVVDGPLFRVPVLVEAGEATLRDGYWFLDVRLTDDRSACLGRGR